MKSSLLGFSKLIIFPIFCSAQFFFVLAHDETLNFEWNLLGLSGGIIPRIFPNLPSIRSEEVFGYPKTIQNPSEEMFRGVQTPTQKVFGKLGFRFFVFFFFTPIKLVKISHGIHFDSTCFHSFSAMGGGKLHHESYVS